MDKLAFLIKVLFFTAAAALAAAVLFFLNPVQESRKTFSLEEKNQIRIFAVGDIMLERGVEYMAKKYGSTDYNFPFLEIRDFLKNSDILFGNLEGPISERGDRVGSIYSFRFNLQSIEALVSSGFNVLSLANNHVLDYGRLALEDTLENLKKNNILPCGSGWNADEAFSLRIKEVKGMKIGFLCYENLGPKSWRAGDDYSGMAWIEIKDIEKIKEDVKEAKGQADILIVSLHAGEEYSAEPDFFQKNFSRTCIDVGADIVIGHHPHVIQKTEKYNDGWISYSLGNFIFDQGFSKETMEGIILEIIIEDDKIKEVVPRKIKMNQFFQPYLET